MYHERKVIWRGELYGLQEDFGMPQEYIGIFGDAWQIALAETILEQPVCIEWRGGKGDCSGTFDITLKMKSQSKKDKFHYVTYKIDFRKGADKPFILEEEHSCEYKHFENVIGRLPGPCKHRIAGRLFLQRNMLDLTGFEMRKLYNSQDYPYAWWVMEKYGEDIMYGFSDLLERSDLDSIQKRGLLYKPLLECATA